MKFLGFIFVCLFVASCASIPELPSGQKNTSETSQGFLQPDSAKNPLDVQEVRPGFLIRVSSPLDSKINGSYRVGFDGVLKLPYHLKTQAAGVRLSALQDKINDQLQPFYKVSPQVKINIADRKYYIEVRGLVQKPGTILVSEREKIEDIIQKSGELSLKEEARMIQIIRGQNTYYVDLQEYFQGRGLNLSPQWFGGEKVFFIKSSTSLGRDETALVQFLGDVRNPGGLAFQDKADLYQYLVKAGGTTPTTDLDRVTVTRLTPQGRFVTTGSADDIAKHIQLEPGDTVFMGSTMPGKYERNIQLGSLIATILSAAGILIIAL